MKFVSIGRSHRVEWKRKKKAIGVRGNFNTNERWLISPWSWSQGRAGEEILRLFRLYRLKLYAWIKDLRIVHGKGKWNFCVTYRNFLKRYEPSQHYGNWAMPIEVGSVTVVDWNEQGNRTNLSTPKIPALNSWKRIVRWIGSLFMLVVEFLPKPEMHLVLLFNLFAIQFKIEQNRFWYWPQIQIGNDIRN